MEFLGRALDRDPALVAEVIMRARNLARLSLAPHLTSVEDLQNAGVEFTAAVADLDPEIADALKLAAAIAAGRLA